MDEWVNYHQANHCNPFLFHERCRTASWHKCVSDVWHMHRFILLELGKHQRHLPLHHAICPGNTPTPNRAFLRFYQAVIHIAITESPHGWLQGFWQPTPGFIPRKEVWPRHHYDWPQTSMTSLPVLLVGKRQTRSQGCLDVYRLQAVYCHLVAILVQDESCSAQSSPSS